MLEIFVSGEYVNYELQTTDDKTQAVNITGVEGGPLLCETKHELNRQRREHKESQQNSSSPDESHTDS